MKKILTLLFLIVCSKRCGIVQRQQVATERKPRSFLKCLPKEELRKKESARIRMANLLFKVDKLQKKNYIPDGV